MGGVSPIRRDPYRRQWARRAGTIALALAVLFGASACTDTDAVLAAGPPAAAQPASGLGVPADAATSQGELAGLESDSAALLATLPVKGRAPKTGYDRTAMFGTAWVDVDANGCDTRNDILARDLTDEIMAGTCKVLSGTLADPYTGTTIAFVRGNTTSTLVQIDHVVALLNAWQSGAAQLTQDARVALANDPLNLFAVDGATNSAKGAGDAATWLPPSKAFRCTYVSHQVRVKAKYGLWVTAAEHDAIARVLGACQGEDAAIIPGEVAAPAPTAAPVGGSTIRPGAYCATQGATGLADNGRTYTCGKKGPDASGRFHWNT